MDTLKVNAEGRSLCIVTGASRGLGRACALEIAKAFDGNFDFVLTARSKQSLDETSTALLDLPRNHRVHCVPCDLSCPTELDHAIDEIIKPVAGTEYDQVFLIHNVGSLGDLSKKAHEYENIEQLNRFMTLNFTGMVALTTRAMREFARSTKKVYIVNITSLMAVRSFPYWSLYSMAKTGRNAYIKCMALEQENSHVRLLSYAPGPLETEMSAVCVDRGQLLLRDALWGAIRSPPSQEIRKTIGDKEQRVAFADMKEKGQLVDPHASAAKVARLLKEDNFESGAHIDYFD